MGKPKIKQITSRPWAKVNFYLKVLRKRSDGYHEIRTLIHPIALFDELVITAREYLPDFIGGDESASNSSRNKILPRQAAEYFIRRTQDGLTQPLRAEAGLIVNCELEDLPDKQNIPPHKDNLITKAVHLFFEKIGEPPLVSVNLIKRIPIGSGLGGGSSDAACALTSLNKLFGYPLDSGILHRMCLELGMDVPFFLKPKPALCIGRGDIIEKRFNSIKFFCILVNPGRSLSTKSVYETLSLTLTEKRTMDNISHFANIKDIKEVIGYIENDLEKPAIKLYPEIGRILEVLRRAGAIKSFVCGSGATVCGLVGNRREAGEVIREVKKQGYGDWWIRVVSSL